jgi:hypothetical protein
LQRSNQPELPVAPVDRKKGPGYPPPSKPSWRRGLARAFAVNLIDQLTWRAEQGTHGNK